MMVKGKTIGALVIFSAPSAELSQGEFQFLHVYATLVSSIVEHAYTDLQAQLLAKTDSLTGIANHRLFTESIEREISRADRRKTAFSLVMIDIDDFKKVNDTHGHLVGDKVLKDLTRRIAALIRRGDLLARYGGEEFALILPDTELEGARTLAERIRAGIADRPLALTEGRIRYTVSMGMAKYDGNRPQTRDDLILASDRALYVSKSRGKNCVSPA
jgi:diguanylate cyclase (GGDEF)-like protein